jgi:hypothetical protein
VRLEKVVQPLIKGPIVASKASHCFTVSLLVKIDFNRIKVHALLDFGASVYFIEKPTL